MTAMTQKLLVIDDEKSLTELLSDHFREKGYLAYTALSADEALELLSVKPDLILLDINMPGTDGLEFCKQVRGLVTCPILFLTARITEQDKVKGLSIGGDDYITKLFSLVELTARVEAHLRRDARGTRKISLLTSQKRPLIAQAMMGNPSLLILDELTTGLDPKERVRIRGKIEEMSEGKIILIATHVVSGVQSIAKEIIFLKGGEVIAADSSGRSLHGNLWRGGSKP
ncbi:response regulator [Anaerovoracaceae bacterium 42-11]